MPPLVLFDIDGTLISRAGPAHREALEEAVLRVTSRSATTQGIPVVGMLDCDILLQMMRACGFSASRAEAFLPEVMRVAQRIYPRRCPDLAAKVCPGVRGFLHRLTRRRAVCGVVSGNLSRIGWTKLSRAGLRPHFRFGAFAEEGRTRAELARRAVEEARHRGWVNGDSRVALVGDHPNDIVAARANGLISVAVGTGVVPWDELTACGPDHAVPDLRSLALGRLFCSSAMD